MVYDDAHADWGHRDNILGASHKKVNIGVASNGRRVTFVQHFEGGALESVERPRIADGVLRLSARKNESGLEVFPLVVLYWEPEPTARTAMEIGVRGSYCVGGGFSEGCGDEAVRILVPPPPGTHYPHLAPNEVVATAWSEDDVSLEVVADIGDLISESGVYTVVAWSAGVDDSGPQQLLELTVVR